MDGLHKHLGLDKEQALQVQALIRDSCGQVSNVVVQLAVCLVSQ